MTQPAHDDTPEPMTVEQIERILRFNCPASCDGNGTYAEDDGEGNPEPAQCQWCYEYGMPARAAVEQEKRAYLQSVLRSRAKTNPDVTIKELYEGLYEQKHDYRAAQLKKGTQ